MAFLNYFAKCEDKYPMILPTLFVDVPTGSFVNLFFLDTKSTPNEPINLSSKVNIGIT